jgi:hypothetical protein
MQYPHIRRHNYEIIVITGEIDPETGFVMDVGRLD